MIHAPTIPIQKAGISGAFAAARRIGELLGRNLHVIATLSLLLLIPNPAAFAITPNSVELAIAELVKNHADQQRSQLVYDPILHLAARAKAHDLANRRYFAHVDPDGYGPNKSASLAGYQFPSWWGNANNANYIESLAAGYADAEKAFEGWMGSTGHRQHILGEIDFYKQQTRYGVGYAEVPGSPYRKYYVFVSAPPNLAGDQPVEPYAEWLFTYFSPFEIDTQGDTSDTNGDGVTRIVEFALGFSPLQQNQLPVPFFNPATYRLEWDLPFQPNLGSVQAIVESAEDILSNSWDTHAITQDGSIYSLPAQSKGFMRLRVSRE